MSAFVNPLFGIYIHWPYCLSKCPYCDFASSVCQTPDFESLLRGYERDILIFKEKINHYSPITSIFFGGGTPSLMPISFCEKLFQLIQKNFDLSADVEISLEANPDAITKNKMIDFKKLGINRLSIGVQALNEADLRFLGRRHSLARALTCVYEAQNVFENVNMDLIYARPTQTVADWQRELSQALALDLKHYSLYQLTIEENTLFGRQHVSAADENTSVELYRLTEQMMSDAGVPGYEISNYARIGFACRHNLTYWRGADYLGLGPAAQGRIGNWETINPRTPREWLKNGPKCTLLTPTERLQERVIMGLRLKQEGFPCHLLDSTGLQKACAYGWGKVIDDLFYPTEEGFLLLNQLVLLVAPETIES